MKKICMFIIIVATASLLGACSDISKKKAIGDDPNLNLGGVDQPCNADKTCDTPSLVCDNNVCHYHTVMHPICETDSDCPVAGQICHTYSCDDPLIPHPGYVECSVDGDCGEGETCDLDTNTCVEKTIEPPCEGSDCPIPAHLTDLANELPPTKASGMGTVAGAKANQWMLTSGAGQTASHVVTSQLKENCFNADVDPNLVKAVMAELIELDPNYDSSKPITKEDCLKLTELDWYNPNNEEKIDKLDGIENLANLKGIGLDGNNIVSVYPISKLKSLIWLSLNWNKIEDIYPISELPELTDIYINGNTKIEYINYLTKLPKLSQLYVSEINIRDWEKFADNLEGKRLTSLAMSGGNLPYVFEKIAPKLSDNARGLYLSDMTIHESTKIKSFKYLVSFECSNCFMPSIEWLAEMRNLTYINLTNSGIQDILPLVVNFYGRALSGTLPDKDDCNIFLDSNPLNPASITHYVSALDEVCEVYHD